MKIIKDIARKAYHHLPYTWRIPKVYYQTRNQIIGQNTKEEIEVFQLTKLKEIVSHAYNNIPGYNQLYRELGIKPSDIRCINDIKLLPIIDKDTIKNNIEDFTDRNIDKSKLHLNRTSGSTGSPFAFYQTQNEEWIEQAFVGKAWSMGGWNIHQSGVMLRGAYGGDENHIIKKCDNTNFYIHNKSYYVSPNFLIEKYYPEYCDFLKKNTNLTYIYALPSSITLLSQMIISHHDEGFLHIKSIYLGSESVFDWQYDFIKEAFPNACVISLYAQTERTIMAYWCKDSRKYHLDPFYGYTEILNNNQDVSIGERGELIGTSFWNTTTPFIRYRTKDYAVRGVSRCEKCGYNYELLERIDGRLQDVLIGKEGRYIPYNAFDGSLLHGTVFKDIVRFKIVQFEKGILLFQIQVSSDFNVDKKNKFLKIITDYLGSDFTVSIEVVNEIQPGKNGKFNIVEQHLPVDIKKRID